MISDDASHSPRKVIRGEHGTRSRGLGTQYVQFGMVFTGTAEKRRIMRMGGSDGLMAKCFPKTRGSNDSTGLIGTNWMSAGWGKKTAIFVVVTNH